MRYLVFVFALVACGNSPAPDAPRAAPGGRPALETSCQVDSDCAVSDTDISGPNACCPGCQWHASNVLSGQRFGASCKSNPPSQCPAIGCAMPNVHAKCSANVCITENNPY